MADEVRLAKADLKRPAPRTSGTMTSDSTARDSKTRVTMEGLWRLMMWGATAAAALLIAVISSRGVVGSQRAAVAVATINSGSSVAVKQQPGQPTVQAENRPFDAQTETKRLSEAVRELASENDRLKARIGMVEHSVDDVTGSIAEQIKHAAAATPPWPDGPPEPVTPASIAPVMAPALPLPMEYGADIGTAASIQALRARWAGIRSAHPQLLGGLLPTVSLSALAPSNHPELRLVVGPFASAEAAAKLCALLQRFHQFCQPTIFAGQHLALE
jgi:hypothetical protein